MKSVYVKFDVPSESYEEAEAKVKETFAVVNEILQRLQIQIEPDILKTFKVVNKVHM